MERTRNNPRITLDDAAAIRRFASNVTAVMAEGRRSGEVRYREHVLESVQIQGVTEEFIRFSTFNAEVGRLMTPTEVRRKRNVAVLGWDTADRLFGALDPIDRQVKIRGVPFRVVGVSRPRVRRSGSRRTSSPSCPSARSRGSSAAVPRSACACNGRPADRASAEGDRGRQLRHLHLGDGAPHLQSGHDRHLRGAGRRRRSRPGRRRYRDHADGGVGAHQGDRAAQGARRPAAGHPVADALGVGGVVRARRDGGRGAVAALALDRFAPVPAVVHPWSVILAITMTAAVGLSSGWHPAARAAALDPIDALGRADCCRARGTDGNWTRVDRKMLWSPAASSSQQRARVLTDVKARRFAPPPLRLADGLDVGSAHARPDWLLPTMPTHTPPTCCGHRPVQNDALSSDR